MWASLAAALPLLNYDHCTIIFEVVKRSVKSVDAPSNRPVIQYKFFEANFAAISHI